MPPPILHLLRLQHQRGRLLPLLREAAAEDVCVRAARDAGLLVSDAELQRAADDFRSRHGLHSADVTRVWLEERQITALDMEAALERDLLIEKLKDHLFAAQGTSRFEADRSTFERVRLRRLLAPSEGAAREFLLRIREEGADLAELARLHHPDPAGRATGGDLGVVARWQLPPAVGTAIFAAAEGEVVGPFPGQQGFHLYRVEGHLPADLDAPTTARLRRMIFDDWLQAKMADVRFDLGCLNGPQDGPG